MYGKFIVVEGLDGSGVSTQSRMLSKYLASKGLKVHLTKEPTSSIIGSLSKSVLSKELDLSSKALQLLFCADRANHLEKEVEPMLAKGINVICDRYLFSTLAYGLGSNINYKWLRSINLNFRMPDLGVVIDVPVSVSLSRISEESVGLQLFDEKEKLQKVRQGYLHIAKEFHLKVVDGTKSIDEVSKQISKITSRALGIQ
jgi:dTMP kinase